MTTIIILVAALLLAYANGANDNFKGVATLFGSGTVHYRRALLWATVTTLLGSLLALRFAESLMHRFSGKGLVSEELSTTPEFAAAVALAAGLTVLLATRFGMPVSTTHALVGALVGVGISASAQLNWSKLGGQFFAPLLISPLTALLGTVVLYTTFRRARVAVGVGKESCFCLGIEPVEVVPLLNHELAVERAEHLTLSLGSQVTCQERYRGQFLGMNAARSLDVLHYLSAGMVSFARGLNDTPKIAALLLFLPAFEGFSAAALCGVVIAVGGLLSARRVAQTMSCRITAMNAGQGFAANLTTGLLVVVASGWGLPVSTTHVSCGSLFGLGAVTGKAHWGLIGGIALAWLTTLPVAAILGWCTFRVISLL